MNFTEGIVVANKFPNHKREVSVYFSDSDNTDPNRGLSGLDIDYLEEIVSVLEKLVSQNDPDEYYQWGADLFSVISNCQISKCRNAIWDEEFKDINTGSLLLFVRALEKFKRKYSVSDVLKSIVGKAFETIKNNPSYFKVIEHGSYYETQIDQLFVSLNLSEEDLKLSVSEYLDDINENLD